MTAAEGGPALSGAATAPAGHGDGARIPARSTAPRLRTVLGLARVEASLLVRSPLVLAGVLAGGAVVWAISGTAEPLWWNAAWRIGFGQLILAMAVLVAAQLAAGRSRRDGLADLYASFPATAGTRTVAHLAGLAGAAPASLLLTGAAAAVVQVRGAIGAPSITVLAGGLLLVIAAGAAGIAIGTRFPHPLAGVLGALVLLLSSGTSHLGSGGGIWLLPWEWTQDELGSLPGPLAGYPPAGAHVLELAGLAVLAGIVALTVTAGRARARAGLATAGILAVAVTCLAGALQLRPIPTAELNHLVGEAADPASVQHCTTASHVRYCLYPGFGRDLASVEAPVNGVLAHLPARPGQPLTLRQVLSPYLLDPTLTHGHPKRQVSQWQAQMRRAPGNAATCIGHLPAGRVVARGRRPAGRRAFRRGPGRRRMGGPPPAPGDRQPQRPPVPALRAGGPGAGGDRDLAGHPRHPPSSGRTPGWPGRPPGRSWLPRGGGPQQHGPDLGLSGLGRQLHHASRGAADHGRGVPAGQRDDEPARTEGHPRPEERLGYLAELAHHRRPARRRARHPHASRARPSGSPRTPKPGTTIVPPGPGSGPQNPVCTA